MSGVRIMTCDECEEEVVEDPNENLVGEAHWNVKSNSHCNGYFEPEGGY